MSNQYICGCATELILSTSNAGLNTVKVMMCFSWDWKGIKYYEILPNNQSSDSEWYFSQLDKLNTVIQEKTPRIDKNVKCCFDQDRAWLHVYFLTRKKLLPLIWYVFPCTPYSLDIAPSDFHSFRSLQINVNSKYFHSLDELKITLRSYLPGNHGNHGKMESLS